MNVGDIKQIKVNQNCTCEEFRGKMCVIETIEPGRDFRIRIRIQRNDNTHVCQHVWKDHLEDVC